MADTMKAFEPVPKLKSDGTNYPLWLARVRVSSVAVKVAKLLIQAPVTGEETLTGKVLATILGKMENSVFMLVMKFDAPHLIMDWCAKHFGQTTAVTTADLEWRLYSQVSEGFGH